MVKLEIHYQFHKKYQLRQGITWNGFMSCW